MNDAEINRYALRDAQARETPASRTMIKYPEQKLTEPEMLVLFELSVLVKHISEMGLNLITNHFRYPWKSRARLTPEGKQR